MNDLSVTLTSDFVATVEIHRPPTNYFDPELIESLATHFEELDETSCRAIVLCSEGKHFCAGVDHTHRADLPMGGGGREAQLAAAVIRLCSTRTPIVAAVQGAAIGGGLGLACIADFRVASEATRFAANFSRLGLHPGFGLTVTLPRIVGAQRANELLLLGARIGGAEAQRIGLCDRLVAASEVRAGAHALATELAEAAPLAVSRIRATLRGDFTQAVARALEQEGKEQSDLRLTADWQEGVRAAAERRTPRFVGR